jgi:hypothetical protein
MIDKILIGAVLFLFLFSTLFFVYSSNRYVFCIEDIPKQYIISNENVEQNITTKCICGRFANCPIE